MTFWVFEKSELLVWKLRKSEIFVWKLRTTEIFVWNFENIWNICRIVWKHLKYLSKSLRKSEIFVWKFEKIWIIREGAKKIYIHLKSEYRFYIHSWCLISASVKCQISNNNCQLKKKKVNVNFIHFILKHYQRHNGPRV